MPRKKITMELMENESARKVSLKKRRLGLLKKVEELTTLCGIDACVVIYSPEENDPMAWPSRDEIAQLLEKFHLEPEMERLKKSTNMETYNKDRLSKSEDQLMKFQKNQKKRELEDLMLQLHQGKIVLDDLNINDLDGLIWLMEPRHMEIKNCNDFYKLHPSSPVTLFQGDIVPSVPPPPQGLVGHDVDISNTGIGYGRERVTIEPLPLEDWFDTNIMEANDCMRGGAGSSSVHNDVDLRTFNTYDPIAVKNVGPGDIGNSSVAPHLGMPGGPSYGWSSSITPNFGLLEYSFHGSSSVAPEIGRESRPLFVGGSSSSVVDADLQLPGLPFGDTSGATSHSGLPPFENFIDPTINMGPGHYSFGPLGSGSPISDYRGNLFGFSAGESGSGGVAHNSIMGPDDKNYPNNP